MKLKHILFTIFIFTTVIAKSQVMWILIFGDKLSNDRIQSGINVSLAEINYIGLPDSKYRTSWALGGFTDIQLNKRWSLQPEFVFKSPTGANNLNNYFSFLSPPDSLIKDGANVYIESVNFTIPIYIKYKTKYFGIGVGPQFSWAYSNHLYLEGETIEGDDLGLKRKLDGEINNFDFGISSLLEFYLNPNKKQTSMRLGLKYYYGITQFMNDYPGVHNSVFMLSFGIPIVSKNVLKEEEQ